MALEIGVIMQRITDPEILRQLNVPAQQAGSSQRYQKITDPNILTQLNTPDQQAPAPQQQGSKGWEPKIWNYPFVGRPPTPQETAQSGQDMSHAIVGGVQGLVNIVPDTLNMINPTSHKIPRANFAPEDTASKIGQFAAPFAGPQMLETGAMKTLSYFPKAMNALRDVMSAKKGATVTNALKEAGKTGAKVGYVNALENPDNPWPEFGKGLAMGSASDLLIPAARSAMTPLALTAKAALGGSLGYMGGQAMGVSPMGMAAGGAATAMGLPLRRIFGAEPQANVMSEMLRGVDQTEAAPVIAANRRLGTNATPGQASNNYVTRAAEERIKTSSDEAAYRAVELEKQAAKQQGNAFSKMLDKIYNPTKKNENAISRLYRESKDAKYDVDPVIVNAMAQEPIIKQAMDNVSRLKGMENVPMNNYEYLSQVKRELDAMHRAYRSSGNAAERIEANNIKSVRDGYRDFLGDNNVAYKQANALAHPRFVRDDLIDFVNRSPQDATGKRVYSTLFSGQRREKEVMQLVKKFPEAKQDIMDMKVGWKHLSDMKTPSQAGGQAAANIDMVRNTGNYIKNWLTKMGSSKGSIARLDYIHTPEWEKGFNKLAEIADKKQRIEKMSKYVMETALKTGLPQKEIGNLLDYLNSTEGDGNSN